MLYWKLMNISLFLGILYSNSLIAVFEHVSFTKLQPVIKVTIISSICKYFMATNEKLYLCISLVTKSIWLCGPKYFREISCHWYSLTIKLQIYKTTLKGNQLFVLGLLANCNLEVLPVIWKMFTPTPWPCQKNYL